MFTSLRRGLTALLAACLGFAAVWFLSQGSPLPSSLPLYGSMLGYGAALVALVLLTNISLALLCAMYEGGARWDIPSSTILFVVGFAVAGGLLFLCMSVFSFHPGWALLAAMAGAGVVYRLEYGEETEESVLYRMSQQ